MANLTIKSFLKAFALTSLVALILACSEGSTAPVVSNTNDPVVPSFDLTNSTLTYADIYVQTNQNIESMPIWSGYHSLYSVTATYQVNPPFPSGVTFDTNTGVISGSSSVQWATSNYTITATGTGFYSGTQNASFDVTVFKVKAIRFETLSLSYSNIGVSYDSDGYEVYTINLSNNPNPTIIDVEPQWVNKETGNAEDVTGQDIGYVIYPELPYWLSFDAVTGMITNNNMIPTNHYYDRFNIYATNKDGNFLNRGPVTVIVAIAVNAINRQHLLELIDEQVAIQGNRVSLNVIDTSRVNNMNSLFYRKREFNGDISLWDVSRVTNMSRMFMEASVFNGDISRWNVGQVTDMGEMFRFATVFNGEISHWDVSQATDMSFMFHSAMSFNGDISLWDVRQVTNMYSMFSDARSFNGDISDWVVSNVTDMNQMFFQASAFNGDLSRWDVSQVTDMGQMFRFSSAFQGTGLRNWANRLGGVTTMTSMFQGTTAFIENLESWAVPINVDIFKMFDLSGVVSNKPTWCTPDRSC